MVRSLISPNARPETVLGKQSFGQKLRQKFIGVEPLPQARRMHREWCALSGLFYGRTRGVVVGVGKSFFGGYENNCYFCENLEKVWQQTWQSS